MSGGGGGKDSHPFFFRIISGHHLHYWVGVPSVHNTDLRGDKQKKKKAHLKFRGGLSPHLKFRGDTSPPPPPASAAYDLAFINMKAYIDEYIPGGGGGHSPHDWLCTPGGGGYSRNMVNGGARL